MFLRSISLYLGIISIAIACQAKSTANHSEINDKLPTEVAFSNSSEEMAKEAAESPKETEPTVAETATPKPKSKSQAPTVAKKPTVSSKEIGPTTRPEEAVPTQKKPASEAPSKVEPPVVVTQEVELKDEVVEVEEEVKEEEKPELAAAVDHSAWDALLQKYVSASGQVDYRGFKAAESKLDLYLKALSNSKPGKSTSRSEAMSYWLNAYNAFTVKLILKNYPVASIQDIAGGKPWDLKWIDLGGKKHSLNEIENEIIRPTYKDARIHFAVNCAAKSCPPLYNRAFVPSKLEQQLEQLTAKFINNTGYNQLSGSLKVSKIFEWYAVDFGDVRAYIGRYAKEPLAAGAIQFAEYDWALNGK